MQKMEKNTMQRMEELVAVLNRASEEYYAHDNEIMSNFRYDELYDELLTLEKQTGITLPDSPSINVGYQSVEELPKEKHESPMLSLNKTKERTELAKWLGEKEGLLSWKLDGLTIVLTYEDGYLSKAVTRGNGEIGEVVTNNARVFRNVPERIEFKSRLVIRGEAVIKYSDFAKINEAIEDIGSRYKNPRNLCSGSVRQLSNRVTAERSVYLYAFALVMAEEMDFDNLRENELEFLRQQGFDVVEYVKVNAGNIINEVENYAGKIKSFDIPSDGLVLTYNDTKYGQSLGRTAKFPRDAIAFKWQDELAETTLLDIEWSPSRTGLVNPVAVFQPVELEGTTVSRASVHNVSMVKALELGIGDKISVYKANMIIPQIHENHTRSKKLTIPEHCPCCGGALQIKKQLDTESLYCINPDCPAKQIKAFTLFVSRDAMNIEGLSEATLEKLVDMGFVGQFRDLYHLEKHKEAIIAMEGMGEKSYNNLIAAINESRNTTLARVIYGLGIPGIGAANGKLLAGYFDNDIEKLIHATPEELNEIEGVGEVLVAQVMEFLNTPDRLDSIRGLMQEIRLQEEETVANELVEGKTFVITGSLETYGSRDELKRIIEAMGGKVAGSVSAKTEALINNDIDSTSSKNKKAKELGIPIITEKDFKEKYRV